MALDTNTMVIIIIFVIEPVLYFIAQKTLACVCKYTRVHACCLYARMYVQMYTVAVAFTCIKCILC